jgi:hypothetical protein
MRARKECCLSTKFARGAGPACQPGEAGYVVAINLPWELPWFAPFSGF